jgi:PAS domain S-box-containing protein
MSETEQKTILIVEDELLIARMEQSILESHGYAVRLAPSGIMAIDMVCAQRLPVDLILMDIDLGSGIDGTQTAQEILQTHDIPIVFISSHLEPEIVARTEKITSYGYVVKNAKDVVLLASIKMAFKLHASNKQVAASARQFQALKRTSMDGFVVIGLDGRILDANDAYVAMTGYDRDTMLKMSIMQMEVTDNAEDFRSHLATLLERGHHRFESKIRQTSGQIIDVAVSATVVPEHRNLMAFVTDITERKRSESAIRESALLYRAMFSKSNAIKLLVDPATGAIVDANAAAAAFYGYPLERLKTLNIRDINTLPQATIQEEMNSAYAETRNYFLFRHRCASGEVRDVEVHSGPIEINGRILLHSIVHDVTERKRAEDALQQERTRLASIIEGTNAGTWEWNVQTGETVFNDRWAELIGYTLDELKPISIDTWGSLTHPDDLQRSAALLELHFKGESEHYECEMRMKHKAGHWVWILDRGRVRQWGADRKPLMMYGTHQDISERKNAEQVVADALALNRKVIESSPVGIMTFKESGEAIVANSAVAAMAGTTVGELERQNFRSLASWKKAGFYDAAVAALTSGEQQSIETLSVSSFGKEVWVSARFVPIAHGGERLLMVVLTDIGDHKRAEKKISDLLEEKELLLKEVHHRVKNNMNTMASILSLQTSAVKDPAAREALKDSEKRLRSMMLLYQKLYRAESVSVMRVDDYLGALLRDIVANAQLGDAIAVTTQLEAFTLDPKQMSAIGIVINELVTNAMKYAFAGRSRGTLRLAATKDGNRITIIVQDDGVGVPASFSLESAETFGLQLVQLVTQQLDGTLHLLSENGTTWTLQFDV